MFQLIVAVISIALVAALAIASIYYGGSAFSASSLRANVVTLVNAGQQISGAQALYKTDFGTFGDLTKLMNGNGAVTYLSAAPGKSPIVKTGAEWGVNDTAATIDLNTNSKTSDVCVEVSRQAGANGQFGCIDSTTTPGNQAFRFKL